MVPILTPDEMRIVDAWAPDPVEVLIERAGAAVARAAVRMLGGTYGRTVNVIAGTGNNGADGRVAARLLEARGVKVRVFDAQNCPRSLPTADLVIDAAFGTGFRGVWHPPDVGGAQVLAVDVPTGVDALTGAAGDHVLPADRTVTFVALKPGLLFPPGSRLAGELELVDVGLDPRNDGPGGDAPGADLVQRRDVAEWWPRRDADAHKWHAAVRIIAGSRAMTGAAALAAEAAQRAGAGMVQVSVPGVDTVQLPVEVIHRPLPSSGWAEEALRSLERFHSIVIGPGLGRRDDMAASTRFVMLNAGLPMVIDGDGLFALAWNAEGATALLKRRTAPTVLTPHDGEMKLLTGAIPGRDRIAAARALARDSGCVVLLKGAATVVAGPGGEVLVVTAGDERLATAGTGDVLAGIIGALLAHRVPALHAAAAGAWVHGRAARLGPAVGFVASDLPDLIPQVLSQL